MNKMPKAAPNVHSAMADRRPEKDKMREIWRDQVSHFYESTKAGPVPLYFTLSGALGLDIESLIKAGIVELNENGSIAADSSDLVVAIESNSMAVAALQKRYPGLRVLQANIKNVLRGQSFFRFPDGDEEVFCRARVVNLDLDQVLLDYRDDKFEFPVLDWVGKFALLHKKPPALDWCLCLTLHGETPWTGTLAGQICEFLIQNWDTFDDFAEQCANFLGDEIVSAIRNGDCSFAELPTPMQQRMLCVVVPKLIASKCTEQGWAITTRHNVIYGGQQSRAPMYSCVIYFSDDVRAKTRRHPTYHASLQSILPSFAQL